MVSRDLINAILYLLVAVAPLTLPLVLGGRFLRAQPEERPVMVWLLLATAGFGLLDFLMLWSLPRLGLSFGPYRLSLMALFAVRVLILAAGLFLLRPAARGQTSILLLNTLLSVAGLYAFYYEPFALRVSTIQIQSPVVPSGQRVRIVQLSDIHMERVTRRERETVARVRELRPDVIVLTGDYLNLSYLRDEQAVADLRWMFSELRAPLGVYAISGSVERPGRMRNELMAGLDITVLDNESTPLDWGAGEIVLVGVSDFEFEDDVENLHRLMAAIPPSRFAVLLYHTPDLAEEAQKTGVDLALVGHTHGGQIRLPVYGALVTFSAFGKRFEQGLYHLGDTQMYVSRGLGMEGGLAPRARFLAWPEIVVVDLFGQ